jgi:hypothetical protein
VNAPARSPKTVTRSTSAVISRSSASIRLPPDRHRQAEDAAGDGGGLTAEHEGERW